MAATFPPYHPPALADLVLQAINLPGLASYALPVGLLVTGLLLGRYGGAFVQMLRGPTLDPVEARKLRAKRTNEHLKLFATFCNTVGAATIGAAILAPYLTQHNANLDTTAIFWGLSGFGLHIFGQLFLLGMRSEG